MKRIVMTAAMLSLLGGTSAFAQQTASGDPRIPRLHPPEQRLVDRRDHRQDRREDRQDNRGDRREDRQDHRADRREDRQDRREDRRDDRHDRREDRRDGRQDHRADRREHRSEPQHVVIVPRVTPPVTRHDGWARHYRSGDGHRLRDRDRDRSHYDYRRYQRDYYAQRRYRAPVYITPSRFYLRNWAFGDTLPYSSWYGSSYYLNWPQYGLPRPPIGAEWIRMRDDALLVDIWTGRVLAVYHNLFW